MSAKTKDNCLICAKGLLSKLKHQEPGMLFFFSDSKNFDQSQNVNQMLMVLEVVSDEVDVMPPHFFPQGFRVNVTDYKVVLKVVCEALDRGCEQRKTGYPPTKLYHLTRPKQTKNERVGLFTITSLQTYGLIVLQNLKLLDYYVCTVVECEVSLCLHNTIKSLNSTTGTMSKRKIILFRQMNVSNFILKQLLMLTADLLSKCIKKH